MSQHSILKWSFVLFITVLASCSKKSSDFEVTGKLDNITGGYFFAARESGDSLRIDTVRVDKKGEFSFRGSVDTLTVVSLYFNQNTKSTYILVDKGLQVELKGDVLFPDLIKVSGGEINDNLTSFKNDNKELLKSRTDILAAANESGKNDSVGVKDYVVELKNINFELSNIAAKYIKENPNKITSVMLINTFFKDETLLSRLDENLSQLKGKAADFPLTKELKRYSEKVKLSAVGSLSPNFTLKNLQNKNVSLSDFRGKYVLLSFVSTTCDMCNTERKDAIRVYNQLKKENKNIEFVTIVKDIETEPIAKNITDSVKWTLLPVHGGWSEKTFESYYIRELPYNILISPSGIILERNFPFIALPEKLEALPDKGKKIK